MFLLPMALLLSLFPYLIFSAKKPFHQRLLDIKDCDLPASAYDLENRIPFTTKVWMIGGRTYMNGTFFMARKTLPIKYSVRGYKIDKGRKKLDFSIEDLSCKNPVISMLLKKFRVKYDTEHCIGFPGNYTSDLISLDELAKTYKYVSTGVGTYTFELGFRTELGVLTCLGMTIEVEK